jgi:cathepsin D
LCKGKGCVFAKKYDPSKSTTSKKKGNVYSVNYLDLALSGPMYSDTLTIGKLSITR